MTEHVVLFDNVVKQYGRVTALAGLSFSAADRGCLGLLGPNGAGKTTAIKSLLGLTHINSGKVVNKARRIGYLPQQPALFGWMTAGEMLRLVGSEAGIQGKALAEAETTWLERLDLAKARHRRISGFSGGMKQRLGLAVALLPNPDVVVLDEPVSALDPVGRHDILALVNDLKTERCIIMSTHILDDAERVCDEVVIMRDGMAVLQKPTADLTAAVTLRYDIELAGSKAPIDEALKTLQSQTYITGCRAEGPILAATLKQVDNVSDLLHTIAQLDGVQVVRIEQSRASLEDIFLQVVNHK